MESNTMGPALILNGLDVDDIPAVVRIHCKVFGDSALTRLGSEAVHRYYKWQLHGPHEVVALGIFCEDQLAGFCFGGVFRGALSGFVQTNRGFLIRRVLAHPWLIANPIFRDRLVLGFRTLQYSRRKPLIAAISQPSHVERSFGILAIAVDPVFQGTGIGKILIRESESQAARQGFARMHLTVHIDNWQAIRFYERMGWEKITNTHPWDGYMSRRLTSS
jgi:ribosomal protein S18 acetylase RimI-like enzyme